MNARHYVQNSLIRDGHDEKAADSALGGVKMFLIDRISQLKAEEKHQEAVWFSKVLHEIGAA